MATLLVYGARAAQTRGFDIGLDVILPVGSEADLQKSDANSAKSASTKKAKVAVVLPVDLQLPIVTDNATSAPATQPVFSGDVAVIAGARSAADVSSAVDADAWLVVEAPRAPTSILADLTTDVFYVAAGGAACAPSCQELPRPELLSGVAADLLTAAHMAGKPAIGITCLTTASGAVVDLHTLRTMLSAVLSAAGALAHGDATAPVKGLLEPSAAGSAQATAGLQAILKKRNASPISHTAVRMFS